MSGALFCGDSREYIVDMFIIDNYYYLIYIIIMKDIHSQSTSRIPALGILGRVTNQSQAILKLILAEQGHLTAERVYEEVRQDLPRISLATVYRNLHKLAEQGQIGRVLVDGVWRFEAETADHYHVMCVACERLDNVETNMASDVEQFFGRWTEYKLTGHELLLFGVCPECLTRRSRIGGER